MSLKDKIKVKQISILLFTTILISFLSLYSTAISYSNIQNIKETKFETEWNYVVTVLKENQNKADIQTSYIKDNIIKDTTSYYGSNKDLLKYDMENMSLDSSLLNIFDKNMKGKFINKDNDNNDFFAISTWQKNLFIKLKGLIFYDKSINCMSDSGDEKRSFDTELEKHYNYELGYDAFEKLSTQYKGDEPIFFEYLPSENINHIKLKTASLDGLKSVFKAEGKDGLKTYEILNPRRINDDSDLLGNQKVTNLGIYNQENRQIVIVQGFSLYDAIMMNEVNYLSIEKSFEMQINTETLHSIFNITLTLVIFICGIKIQNLTSDLEVEVDDENLIKR